jgi:hypothetical protein
MSFRLATGRDWHKHISAGTTNLMPTLMVDFIISLDGYGAADGWPCYGSASR